MRSYPELRAKINLFAALSPVVYLVHTTSALLKACGEFRLADAIYDVYKQGFLVGSYIEHKIEVLSCTVTQQHCSVALRCAPRVMLVVLCPPGAVL
jgi:hypothetical protein